MAFYYVFVISVSHHPIYIFSFIEMTNQQLVMCIELAPLFSFKYMAQDMVNHYHRDLHSGVYSVKLNIQLQPFRKSYSCGKVHAR